MFIIKPKHQFLTIVFIHLSCFCYAQKESYNFHFQDATLEMVLKELSNHYKINVLYNPSILPQNVKISGDFKNLMLKQALDTFLSRTPVSYKFYKKDVVLYRKNEEVKETHRMNRTLPPKKADVEKFHETITDTVTFAITTHDTIVTRLSEFVKVPVMDTVKVYDTIKVIKRIIKPVSDYKPKDVSIVAGLSFSKSIFFSTVHMIDPGRDSSGSINASLHEKQGNSIGLSLLYRNKNIIIETGINLSKNKYSFVYTKSGSEFITVLDTVDRYYTGITGVDTSWVYVTEEREVKQISEKKYYSDLEYQYISVPILFGYSLILRNLTLEFKAGAIFNFYLGSKGSYLTSLPNNEIMVEDAKAPNSKASMGAFGAFAIDYYLSTQFHIFAQPSISWMAVPLDKKHANYYITDLQFGIHLGIRYYF